MKPLSICVVLLYSLHSALCSDLSWPQFRGPDGQGNAPKSTPPLSWSENENVLWKTEIPGEGWSSPVVGQGKVWMTTATENGKSLRAVAVSLKDGKQLHDIEVFQVEQPGFKHSLNSYASPTPILEPDRLYLHFGTFGNAAIDTTTGKVLWKSTELQLEHENGPGSSPAVYKNLLIIPCDGTNVQYLAALDKNTGKVAWKSDRSGKIDKAPPMKKAYSTPLIIQVQGKDQVVTPAAEYVYAYEPGTGKEIWRVHYPGFSNVPRPIFDGKLLYVCTGFGKPELWAIDPTGSGDVTGSHVRWIYKKQVPAKPSPLLVGERLYMVSDNGVATCLDKTNGKEIWQERLGGEYSASLLFAGGHIFASSHEGHTRVFKPADELKVLWTNKVESGIMASLAAFDKTLILRSKKAIYRIEQK